MTDLKAYDDTNDFNKTFTSTENPEAARFLLCLKKNAEAREHPGV
jgi:hypothetical protein